MTPPVLAGVDGSPASTAAAHWAAEEALRRDAPLRLVHAWPWLTDGRSAFADADALPAAAQQVVFGAADAIRRRHPGLAVHADVVLDAAVDGLVAAAADAGLLVLGSRGLGGFAGLLLGSVSMATAARSAVPAVVVRPGGDRDATVVPPEVVVGVDPRAVNEAVLAFAFHAAGLRGARLRAVHGWDLPPAFATVGFLPSQPEVAELQELETEALSSPSPGGASGTRGRSSSSRSGSAPPARWSRRRGRRTSWWSAGATARTTSAGGSAGSPTPSSTTRTPRWPWCRTAEGRGPARSRAGPTYWSGVPVRRPATAGGPLDPVVRPVSGRTLEGEQNSG